MTRVKWPRRVLSDALEVLHEGRSLWTPWNDPCNTGATRNGTCYTRGAIGDCTRDTFTITAPNNFAPPLICGFNTGQHMIVDACPNECHEAVFGFSGTGTRSWNIKVTQYQCGDEQGATHLSNQCYTMCWRQNENICAICWIPVVLGSDTVSIPDAQVNVAGSPDDTFIIGSIPQVTNIVDRVCGRYFSSADSAGDRRSSLSIC
eukprot:maker-scaffold326_size205590-snap-gene-0.14 protein:Tk02471 transcript:maker-scaffold326_size205590-snap-gene-0.14-mRNA-1 annotation:"hypothetical protein"